MFIRMFPSRTLAFYTAKMFLMRTFAFLAGLALILMTLDLLGESARILAVPGNGDVARADRIGTTPPAPAPMPSGRR